MRWVRPRCVVFQRRACIPRFCEVLHWAHTQSPHAVPTQCPTQCGYLQQLSHSASLGVSAALPPCYCHVAADHVHRSLSPRALGVCRQHHAMDTVLSSHTGRDLLHVESLAGRLHTGTHVLNSMLSSVLNFAVGGVGVVVLSGASECAAGDELCAWCQCEHTKGGHRRQRRSTTRAGLHADHRADRRADHRADHRAAVTTCALGVCRCNGVATQALRLLCSPSAAASLGPVRAWPVHALGSSPWLVSLSSNQSMPSSMISSVIGSEWAIGWLLDLPRATSHLPTL